jgi:hypothetical protein
MYGDTVSVRLEVSLQHRKQVTSFWYKVQCCTQVCCMVYGERV